MSKGSSHSAKASGLHTGRKIPERSSLKSVYDPDEYTDGSRRLPTKPPHPPVVLVKKPQSNTFRTPTPHQSTATGKSQTRSATNEEVRASRQEMADFRKKSEETKKRELLTMKQQYDSMIKDLEHRLKESQKNCKKLQMQVSVQIKEASATERMSRQAAHAAQMRKTSRKRVDSISISSAKQRDEFSTRCTPAVANDDHAERFKKEMVQDFMDKTVAKVRAELFKEKENEIKKLTDEMSRIAQEEKRVAIEKAVNQVSKEKEKEINRVKDELHRSKEELDRVKAERAKEMEVMRARLRTQNESMDSLKAEQLRAKEADKAKTDMTDMTRELGEQMHKLKAKLMKQKENEMDELRATLLKKKDQEIDEVRDEMVTKCQQQAEQLKANMMKEKRKEMEMLRAESREKEHEIHDLKAKMTQRTKEMEMLRAELREKEHEIHDLKANMTQKIARETEQLKIDMMNEQRRERGGEIGKLRSEMAIEKDREVKSIKTNVIEEKEKEMQRMREMLLRDKKEEIAQIKAGMEREMEKSRTETMRRNEIELEKLRSILKDKEKENDKLNAAISERDREFKPLTIKEKGDKSGKSSPVAAHKGYDDTPYATEHTRTNTRVQSAPRVHGLSNLGNTCYMNAALQCVYGTAAFKDAFMKDLSGLPNGELSAELRNLLKEMSSASKGAVKPLQLKLLVQNSFHGFSGSSQQDSQEFLTALLQRLHEELSTNTSGESTEESLVSRVFHGQLQTTLNCENCHQATLKCDPFMFLSVSIPSQAQQGKTTTIELTDCLKTFTKEEFFGDNCWFCTQCNKHADMRRKAVVSIPPQVLIVYLKRFRQDSHGIRHKITATVQFPRYLDLTTFMTSGKSAEFNLFAVINHAGTISSGHYTAFCKHGTQWYQFDDSRVTTLNENEIVTSGAYVLFYTSHCSSS